MEDQDQNTFRLLNSNNRNKKVMKKYFENSEEKLFLTLNSILDQTVNKV